MKKAFFLIAAFIGFMFNSTFIYAQHLFSLSYNDLSSENVMQLSTQLVNTEVSTLSLIKNNNKDVYPVAISAGQNTKIIILNEQTGAHVAIIPVEESLTEFQLTPFFIEELKQAALGDAHHYLIMEANSDLLIKSVTSVSAAKREVFIPQYFYGKKENVKEALPKDRKIINIYKQKPRIISDFPDDPEYDRYIAQLEEEMSYYVYMYQLPDGTLCTYDEHFNPDNGKEKSRAGNILKFNLSGWLDETQRFVTEYALELWGEQLAGMIPVDINVDFFPLGEGVIGMAYFPTCYFSSETNTWYPSALWNQMVGYNASGMGDIEIIMNSDFRFYYGLDGNAGNRIDYVTLILHEAAHGLGFGSQCHTNGSFFYGTHPVIYDRMLCQGLDGPCMAELTQSERAALIISNNLYAGRSGSNLLAANGGVRVKMFAPTTYRPGSTAHHWDNNVSFRTFMKFAYDYPLHTFNTRKIGLFLDMGWALPEIDPNAVWVTFNANGGGGNMNPQPFDPDFAQNLKINAFTRTGYTFKNWNTLPNGTGTAYTDREAISISNNVILYAQWEANRYTLAFYTGGGVVSPTSKQVIYDSPIGELPIPVREGYRFDEWKLRLNTLTEETIWGYTENLTASARWTFIVGIDDVKTNNNLPLQIIPNPASHSIELRITNYELRIDKIEFYNIFGQLVKSVPFAGQTTEVGVSQNINISDLNAGIYMIRVGSNVIKLVIR